MKFDDIGEFHEWKDCHVFPIRVWFRNKKFGFGKMIHERQKTPSSFPECATMNWSFIPRSLRIQLSHSSFSGLICVLTFREIEICSRQQLLIICIFIFSSTSSLILMISAISLGWTSKLRSVSKKANNMSF